MNQQVFDTAIDQIKNMMGVGENSSTKYGAHIPFAMTRFLCAIIETFILFLRIFYALWVDINTFVSDFEEMKDEIVTIDDSVKEIAGNP